MKYVCAIGKKMTLRRRRSMGRKVAAVALLLTSLALSPHAALAKSDLKAADSSAPRKTEAALSGGQKALGTFGGWRAFSFEEQGQMVCYMALPIRSAKPKGFARGASRLTITHRPSENSRDVVSYAAGYVLKPGSDVTVTIGKASFSLFTAQSSAWARDPATDRALAKTLRHAATLAITGVPAKQGAADITDKLDVSGADQAYRAMSKACGIEVPIEKRPKPAAPAATKKPPLKKDAKAAESKSSPAKQASKPSPPKHALPSGHPPKTPPARNQVE